MPRFSENFGITISDADDFFDPLLNLDTPLYVDPYLIWTQETGEFTGAHAELTTFFQEKFNQAAQMNPAPGSASFRQLVNDLRFPEFEEACIGMTAASTHGSGSGIDTARAIVNGLRAAIDAGLREPGHFEQIAIFGEGIGADRISDATCWLLRRRFAAYTKSICETKNVPLQNFQYPRVGYDGENHRWIPGSLSLPRNPFNGKAVILIPRRFLRQFPMINAGDFWQYCFDNNNAFIRERFGNEISRSVNKDVIIELARTNPRLVAEFVGSIGAPEPYDLDKDPDLVKRWYDASLSYVSAHPLRLSITRQASFDGVIRRILLDFKHFVEENSGWELLTNEDGSLRKERIAQRALLGILSQQCRFSDIDVSPEANIGRGPVDFKVSRGYHHKALIEVKLAKNSRFWHGLESQLPTYLKAEERKDGFFVIVALHEDDKQLREARRIVRVVNQDLGLNIRVVVVYADRSAPGSRA